MFDRLLTGPVVREEGVRRRGRRPKSEIAKAAAAQASLSAASSASTSGVNPFLLNSLFGGMDLSSLQNLQNLQNLQLLMGLSPSLSAGAADNKNTPMLPLMLPAMGALPNVFSLGGLFGGNMAAAAANLTNTNANTTAASDSEETKKDGEPKEDGEEKNDDAEKPAETDSSDVNVAAAAATNLSATPLAFNPFLLSTMAPGLFYPSMFLPPGLGGLGLPGFSPAALTELQNAMSGALGAAGEEKEANKEAGQNQDKVKPGSTLENSDSEEGDKTEDLTRVAEELDSVEAGEEEEEDDDDDDEVGDDDEDE